ncbi:RluA family pseudouridine synthase [Butyrivibrio sp. MB2005]|uniref:RluA family pseudouridine synthase n=1 Tax=Butyrivibrio sp. MB2005 TaxID=1280678 RepID=UPI00041FAFF7|nr:RluA family pseudouridine synthase [Butyrivibrio sp. MB2005]
MRDINITDNEAGKRLDKFLSQYFTGTTMGFLFKMLRKKNIVLNKKKATGKEVLKKGDTISVFFSDETFGKFANKFASASDDSKENDNKLSGVFKEYELAYKRFGHLEIIYEDDNILLINKPAGILTQKAEPKDLSLNEWLIGYLLDKGAVKKDSLVTFRPSVCNRLDRNTSGIVICSKSLIGAREMAKGLKERTIHKYYSTIVAGKITENAHISGYLIKDEKNNKVRLVDEKEAQKLKDADRIETSYEVSGYLKIDSSKCGDKTTGNKLGDRVFTELSVCLITGKTHQIRAHLSSTGHPIIGDGKYGSSNINMFFKECAGLKYQLLHARRIELPEFSGELSNLSGKAFEAGLSPEYKKIKEITCQPGTQEA